MSYKTEIPIPEASNRLCEALHTAVKELPTYVVLQILTIAFVELTVEVMLRQGLDVNTEIPIEGGQQRDITIHASKEKE